MGLLEKTMVFKEIYGNLFEHTADRVPVHCISQDCKMGAGIAVPMKKEYHLRLLRSTHGRGCSEKQI